MKHIGHTLTRDEINLEVWKGILIGLVTSGFATAILLFFHHVKL